MRFKVKTILLSLSFGAIASVSLSDEIRISEIKTECESTESFVKADELLMELGRMDIEPQGEQWDNALQVYQICERALEDLLANARTAVENHEELERKRQAKVLSEAYEACLSLERTDEVAARTNSVCHQLFLARKYSDD